MKKHIQRLLFATLAILLGGANSAWAATGDVTTNANIDFSNAITGTSPYTIEGAVGKMTWTQQWTYAPAIVDGRLRFGNFNGGVVELQNNNIGAQDKVTISFDMAFGKLSGKHVGFKLVDADSNDLLTQWFDAYNGDFDDANPLKLNWDYMYHGSNTVIQDRCVYFTIVIDYATKKINTTTKCFMSGTGKAATDGAFESNFAFTAPIAKFVLQGNINNADRYSTLDNLKITTTEGNSEVASASYTINYLLNGEGEPIKVTSGTESVGQTVNAESTFWVNNVKYFLNNGENPTSMTIASGTNVLNVNVREAATYTYTVNASYGTQSKELASGSVYEGESATVAYPEFVLDGTTLYSIVNNGSGDWFRKTISPTSTNYVETLTYNNGNIENVAFYTEAEDIEGVSTGTNTARASKGQMGFTANNETYKGVTTLPVGKYKIYLKGVNGNSATRTANFKVGENIVFTASIPNGTNTRANSEEFIVEAPALLSFASDGSSASGVDWFYIVKTGDYNPYAVENYTVNFNTAITTSNHDFAVASNWGHIVGSDNYDGYGPYYMYYGYSADGGVDGSGALNVGAQNGYWGGSTQSQANFTDGNYDYLITPTVNGTISLKVKRFNVSGYESYVKVFKVNDAGTVVGDEVTAEISPAITADEWSTLTLSLTSESRLAIRAQAVLLDNFTAESATIVKVPGMTITSVKCADSESTTYFDANADGTYTVKYLVKVTNTGETALVAGTTENYSLSVSIDGTTYGSFNVPVSLAINETSEEFEAAIVVPSTAPTGWKYRYLTENLGNTKDNSSLAWSNVIAYNPVPFFIKQGNEPNSKGSSLTGVTALDFGMISVETTENYKIFAHNAGDLQIKSITAPEGFTVTPAEALPYTINAHSGMNVDVTANAVATASGNMVITYVDKDGNDATQNIALTQTVVDASKWLATFDDNTWPANTVHQSSLSIYNSTYSNISYAVTADYSYSNLFITPLLTAAAGEKFTFDARLSASTGTIKVYVTKNRSNLGDAVLSLSNSQLNTSNFTAQELTINDAGDYYVVFEIYKAYIDNLYGLEKVDVAHDIMVNAYKIGMYAEDKTIQTGTEQSFSFEILPVQEETAEAYTVKLFANNEEVATVTSTALTAGTSKTFTLNWTPEVTSTTVFETHAEIIFADNTKVVSPSLNLTVTCEPVFVFFDAGTAVYSSQPSNRSKAITFGKTNVLNQVQNFEIYNYGKANLTVKSITVPEGFSVNVSDATVEPATRQAVDITFSTDTPGLYEGNLTIVYVDGDGVDQTFELAVSGTMLDPTKWYANFDNTTSSIKWPAGSVYEKNLQSTYHGTYSDNNYHIYQSTSYSSDTKFITPLLEATAGETFSFDVAPYSSSYNGTVAVYLSTDRQTWGDAIETITVESSQGTNTFVSKSVTIPSAGQYYVAIEPYNAKVDEIYGLTPVAVKHDWQIASSSIPAEVMQNAGATATINIRNLGLTAEAANSYKATLYVDEEPIATVTETAAIPTVNQLSATGTQISISFHYGVVGTVKAYIVVEAADGYKVNTDAVDINFTGEIATADGIQVGTQSGTGNGFVDWYNNDGSYTRYTDILYPATKISTAGIKAGDKITSISFKASNSAKAFKAVVTSWVGLSTGTITYGSPVKEDMQEVEVYNGSIDFPANVESVITLASPIVWDGTSDIRVYTEAAGQGSGNWMSASYAYDSEITMSYNGTTKAAPVAFFTLAAEPAATLAGTVKLGGSPVEGATVTLTSQDADKVQYTGTTNASGEYSIEVIQSSRTYTVTADYDGAAATVKNVSDFSASVDLALVALPELTFGDADFSTTETKANVTITRGLKAGWNAIILPVTLTAYEVTSAFGTNAEVAVYSKDEDAENVTIQFSKTTKIVAGTPCLLWLEEVPATAPRFVNKDINTTVNKVSGQSFSFTGVYEATTVKAGDYFVKNGEFKKAGNNNTVKPFRSYLQLNEGASARSIRFFIDDEEIVESEITGIETVKQTVAPQGTYSMSGQKMEGKLRKGLYIINGKKVMVK